MTSSNFVVFAFLLVARLAMSYHLLPGFTEAQVSGQVAPEEPSLNDFAVLPDGEEVQGATKYVYSELSHEYLSTIEVTWKYGTHPITSGLTSGILLTHASTTLIGFVGFRNSSTTPLLRSDLALSVGVPDPSDNDGRLFCPKGHFVTSMICKDARCGSIELICAPLSDGLRPGKWEHVEGRWPRYKYGTYCPNGLYLDGIRCNTACYYNFNIYCTDVEEQQTK